MDILGLQKLPPEIAEALQPVLDELEAKVDQTIQSGLTRVDKIVESALDRIDGAQVVVVCTVKLPEAGSRIGELVKPEGQT